MIRALITAALCLLLAGCAAGSMFEQEKINLPVSATLPKAGQEAQRITREGHLAVASAAAALQRNNDAGIWPVEKVQQYKDRLADVRAKLVDARTALKDGLFDLALSRAKLYERLLMELQRELAEAYAAAEAAKKAKP